MARNMPPDNNLINSASSQSWIMHLDMDAFFASIEQMDAPELKGRPVIVGGTERGVVCAASYEVRPFGVRSAMPMFQARRLCPHAVVVPVRRKRYQEISAGIMRLLECFSPRVEKASIDEAYLDATGLERLFGSVEEIARNIKRAVRDESGLSCSIGVAPVKFLAKIASDLKKPDGLSILYPADIPGFLESLPIESIPGVGRHTLLKIKALGIRTAGQASRYPAEYWGQRFGKMGIVLHERVNGIDPRQVNPFTPAKSESAENTFAADVGDFDELCVWLLRQAERVGASLRKHGLAGRTITLKVKYRDFTQVTRSRTLKRPTNGTRMIYESAVGLLRELDIKNKLRLIGIGVSQFGEKTQQLSLFQDELEKENEREALLDKTMDSLRERFGDKAPMRGGSRGESDE